MEQKEITTEYKVIEVASKAFAMNGSIPVKYTCEGDDVNPPLDIGNIPAQAKSLALIVEDPDAPRGSWLHWLVWNIPVTHHIKDDDVPGDEGVNDFGKQGYGGPCPPSGTHRYVFKVYALDSVLELGEGAGRRELQDAMADHVLAYGEITGVYRKIRS